jgi:hypothetical protein
LRTAISTPVSWTSGASPSSSRQARRRIVDRDARLRQQPFDETVVAGAALVERTVREIDEAVLAAAKAPAPGR